MVLLLEGTTEVKNEIISEPPEQGLQTGWATVNRDGLRPLVAGSEFSISRAQA